MSSAAHRPPASGGLPRLLGIMFGADAVQRRAIKRFLLLSHAYVVFWLVLEVSVRFGYSPPVARFIILCGALGLGVFYAILRAGLSLKLQDPLLCMPQALFGAVSVVLVYALVPLGEGAALQVLFMILVFDLHRLTSRQIAVIATLTVAMIVALVTGKWLLEPASIDLRQEALNLSMALLVVPLLSMISAKVRQIHLRQIAQKAELDSVLARLKVLSQRDAMTGTFNRRHMLELLDDEHKRQRRTLLPFCVAMLDIDHFKQVNDTHGHAVGDRVLRQMTLLAGAALRDTDALARWGGEEFLVLLPDVAVSEACSVIERLRLQVEQYDWSQCAPGLRITFSSGVACHVPQASVQRSIELADAALYRAKQAGRNRVEQG